MLWFGFLHAMSMNFLYSGGSESLNLRKYSSSFLQSGSHLSTDILMRVASSWNVSFPSHLRPMRRTFQLYASCGSMRRSLNSSFMSFHSVFVTFAYVALAFSSNFNLSHIFLASSSSCAVAPLYVILMASSNNITQESKLSESGLNLSTGIPFTTFSAILLLPPPGV